MTQNESPVSVLGNFVEVLGRKIDSCEDQLEIGITSQLEILIMCLKHVGLV